MQENAGSQVCRQRSCGWEAWPLGKVWGLGNLLRRGHPLCRYCSCAQAHSDPRPRMQVRVPTYTPNMYALTHEPPYTHMLTGMHTHTHAHAHTHTGEFPLLPGSPARAPWRLEQRQQGRGEGETEGGTHRASLGTELVQRGTRHAGTYRGCCWGKDAGSPCGAGCQDCTLEQNPIL